MRKGKQIILNNEGRFVCDHKPEEFFMKFTLKEKTPAGRVVDEGQKVPWCFLDTYKHGGRWLDSSSNFDGQNCPDHMGVSKKHIDVYGKNTPGQKLSFRRPGVYCIVIEYKLGLLENNVMGDRSYSCFEASRTRWGTWKISTRGQDKSSSTCKDYN